MSASFRHYFAVPSATISDRIVNVPLHAVTCFPDQTTEQQIRAPSAEVRRPRP